MLRIAKIDESNKQHMIDLMKTDIMRHVFAFYDLQYEPENKPCMRP